MTEIVCAIAGILGGIGIGFVWGQHYEARYWGSDGEKFVEAFKRGVEAQKELGVLVKRVPIEEKGPVNKRHPDAAPSFSQDWEPPQVGTEHPGGPRPPSPEEVIKSTPTNWHARLKSGG
jgi:hypothetical protein